MPNVRLTLAYDGTAYHGFQKQPGSGLPTIQETLERCLAELSGAALKVTGAGRTDAGVHARGQVVNFVTGGWGIPTARIPAALNGVLPGDIAAVEAREVPADFHARYSATAKTYSYTLYNHPVRCPFHRPYSLHVPRVLDLGAMRRAARHLTGTHDFSAFQAAGRPVPLDPPAQPDPTHSRGYPARVPGAGTPGGYPRVRTGAPVRSAVRTLTRADVEAGAPVVRPGTDTQAPPAHPVCQVGAEQAHAPLVRPACQTGAEQAHAPLVRLVFSADGFLYNMVRIITGTLLEVGLGRLDPEALPGIIAAGDRARAGPTAPPHGLCLESVTYP
ncbi:MAG: tRNA pseudouridine synthase A [Bacillota bacterium]